MLLAPTDQPSIIERAADQTVSRPVYLGDVASPTAPTEVGSTFSLLDPDGTAIIDAEGVTITSAVATYPITAAEVPGSLDLSERYVVVWSLLVSGTRYTIREPAAVVLRRLYCPVATSSLLDTLPALASYRGSTVSHLTAIRAAWSWTQRRLLQAGRRPWLVIGSDALEECTRYRAIGNVLRDMSLNVGEPERFLELARHYDYEPTGDGDPTPMGEAQRAWGRLRLAYDHDEDGVIDAGDVDTGRYPAARGW